MTIFVQHASDAISLGALYALLGLGIGLIYGIMRLVNFAHGDFIMIGGYTLFVVAEQNVVVMIVATILMVVALALVSERLVFRPLRRASPATLLIGSVALSYFLSNFILVVFLGRPKTMAFGRELIEPFEILGVRIPQINIVVIAMTIVLMAGLALFLKRTTVGTNMRAAAEDFVMAQLLGVRANVVISMAFAVGGFLAAMVALLYFSQTGSVSPRTGLPLVIIAFVATVVGGLGSLVGAALGGFVVGVVSVVLQIALPVDLRPFRDAFVFALVILMLVFRPGGLLIVQAMRERV